MKMEKGWERKSSLRLSLWQLKMTIIGELFFNFQEYMDRHTITQGLQRPMMMCSGRRSKSNNPKMSNILKLNFRRSLL